MGEAVNVELSIPGASSAGGASFRSSLASPSCESAAAPLFPGTLGLGLAFLCPQLIGLVSVSRRAELGRGGNMMRTLSWLRRAETMALVGTGETSGTGSRYMGVL